MKTKKTKLKTFEVKYSQMVSVTFTVKAASPEKAEAKAEKLYEKGDEDGEYWEGGNQVDVDEV